MRARRKRTSGTSDTPTWSLLAPHVDAGWAEDFVVELRLRGVTGTDIGAALAEVESHCGESGESAADSFGDPQEYAGRLQLRTGTGASARVLALSVAPVVTQVLGMLVVLSGFAAWRAGDQLEVTVGHLVTTVVFIVLVAALARFSGPVLRMVIHHPVLLWLTAMLNVVVCVGALLLLDGVVWRVDAMLSLGVGTLALVGGLLWATVGRRRGSIDDPIASPLGVATASSGYAPMAPARSGRSLLTGPALIPGWTVVMLAVTWWLGR